MNKFKKTLLYKTLRKIIFAGVGLLFVLRKKLQEIFLKKKAVIVLYHRVAAVSNDPSLLCVTPKTFEAHLQFYKENYSVIGLGELIEKITTKTLAGDELVITFDDGYQDNLTTALPILEQHNLPATIFITTGNLGAVADFEWDQKYASQDRATFLSQEEIRTLAHHPLITIGAHTVTHPKLSTVSPERALKELEESRRTLESIIGTPVTFFAYPFGGPLDFTCRTEVLTKKAGYVAAIANNQLFATNKSPLTAIPRINIRGYSAEQLSAILHTL